VVFNNAPFPNVELYHPAIYAVLASIISTDHSFDVVPEACCVHVVPPFVVFIINPPSDTA